MPSVDHAPVHADEVYRPVAVHRRKERVTRLGQCRIVNDESRSGASDLLLVNRSHARISWRWKTT